VPSFQELDRFRQPFFSRFIQDAVFLCGAGLADILCAKDRNQVTGIQIVFIVMVSAIVANTIAVDGRIIGEVGETMTMKTIWMPVP